MDSRKRMYPDRSDDLMSRHAGSVPFGHHGCAGAWFVAVSTVVGCLAGCAQPEKKPTVETTLVRWSDVGPASYEEPRSDFVELTTQPTKGLFPCSLAVARLRSLQSDLNDAYPWTRLADSRVIQEVDWTELFDERWEIAETFPLSLPPTSDINVSPSWLVERAADVGANLCLVYRSGRLGPDDAEVRGVLYDSRSGDSLAAIRAAGHVDPIADTAGTPPDRVEGDQRHLDALEKANRKFRTLVRQAVDALVARDQSDGATVFAPTTTATGDRVWANRPAETGNEDKPDGG